MANEYWEYTKIFFTYVGWWLIPLLVTYFYRRALMKYPIDAIIYEKRGENLVKTNDMAGRFDSPVACYRLKISKDTIQIPQYDWVLQCMHKPTNLFEKLANLLVGRIGSITLFKYSSKQYKPIDVKIDDTKVKQVFKEVKDKDGQPVYIQVYEYINPKQSLSKLNFEVIDWDDINHMTQELRAIALRRAPLQTFLEKYGHWLAFGLAVMTLIIAGYFYKEMMIDAGNKFQSMTQGRAPSQQQTPVATGANIPVIGNIVTPGA